MKRSIITLLVCLMLAAGAVFGQSASKLKAYIDQKTYFSPGTGDYAEIHFQFVGYSLHYFPVEGGLQTKLAIYVDILDKGNDTVKTEAYLLESPVMRDSIIEDFFDVLRISLNPGVYTVNVSLQDLVSHSEPMTGQIELVVESHTNTIGVSDIMIAEVATKTTTPTVFSKSGFDLIPRISNFYPSDLSSMPFYIEMYNSDLLPDTLFGIRQRIISSINGEEVPAFSRLTKMKTAPVVPLLRNLDISLLPSGSYQLEVALMDRNNLVQGKPAKYYFERINEIDLSADVTAIVLDPAFQASVTDDSVDFYLSSLIPISRPAEAKSIIATLKQKNGEKSRKHLQQFWVQTSGTNAANAWRTYKQQVLMVEKLYGNNFQSGHETDRGRVYLQYGPPNTVTSRESSPTEYPYEIWHYYKIKMYSNKRFVFYNPDLVNNGYRLLHSDMVGEQQNYRWQSTLSKRSGQTSNIDDPTDGTTNHYGGESNSLYRQE